MSKEPFHPNQSIPLLLTIVVFILGTVLLIGVTSLLNLLPFTIEHIKIIIHPADVLIGLTIYLKTSIDFAIFIGRLMSKYPGWKNRIAIEIGTALGNILGTLIVLSLWDIFREVKILMAGMIVLAALVLLRLAQEGLEHVKSEEGKYHFSVFGLEVWLEKILQTVNNALAPILNLIIPRSNLSQNIKPGFVPLFLLSFTIPFLLGADDFAGYIPLFNIINVVGFATGVFLGHMLLNIALFISPHSTITVVKNPVISFLGSLAFIGLALWGFHEAYNLIFFSH